MYAEEQKSLLISNKVGKDTLKEFQKATLNDLKEALIPSFGPMGSNTVIASNQYPVKYTKDGHEIICAIHYMGSIEESVRKNVEDITRNTVKGNGDGTTGATIISSLVFDKLTELSKNSDLTPYQIITSFKNAVQKISEEIYTHAVEFNADTAYKIAYISTNGNEVVSKYIKDIYTEFGNDVFIDVNISNIEEHQLKIYDGMTLDVGYADKAFINNDGACILRNPKIYAFQDPIDTIEMRSFLEAIIQSNIFVKGQVTPTVIMAPKISRDNGSFIDKLITNIYNVDECNRPPLLLITNIYDSERYNDIIRMCGCPLIRKYIDPKQQQKDIEANLAPSIDTIANWCGSAEEVNSDLSNTKFINPKMMYTVDENGERIYSQDFNGLINYLKGELNKAYENNESVKVTGALKRRINALKSNMVEYLVGGISVSDRDSLKALVEDAVLNCRSAADKGVGYGACFEGLRASKKLYDENKDDIIYRIIYESYYELTKCLYMTIFDKNKSEELINQSIKENKPFDLRNNEFNDNVLSSIKTDVVVLEGVSKIITLLFTSNQYLCSSIGENKYLRS